MNETKLVDFWIWSIRAQGQRRVKEFRGNCTADIKENYNFKYVKNKLDQMRDDFQCNCYPYKLKQKITQCTTDLCMIYKQ
jgi:hypothetical protein